jgi:WhiB family redox-sensing transcriptional regulator
MNHQYTLTAVSTHATDWRQHAACRDIDPDLFFPPPLGARMRTVMQQVRAICDPCPVRKQCLQFALDVEGDKPAESRHGLWAATTPRQRWRKWRCDTGRCEHPQHKQEGVAPVPDRPKPGGWRHAAKPCTVDGCDAQARGRGLCSRHYRAWVLETGQFTHGTAYGYDTGCRCEPCRAANRRRRTRRGVGS